MPRSLGCEAAWSPRLVEHESVPVLTEDKPSEVTGEDWAVVGLAPYDVDVRKRLVSSHEKRVGHGVQPERIFVGSAVAVGLDARPESPWLLAERLADVGLRLPIRVEYQVGDLRLALGLPDEHRTTAGFADRSHGSEERK